MASLIKIDLDDKSLWNTFLERAKFVLAFWHLTVKHVWVAETAKGYHVVIITKEKLQDQQICFLQLAMGSDYKRECFNLARILRGEKDWNLLFKTKEQFRPDLTCRLLETLSQKS